MPNPYYFRAATLPLGLDVGKACVIYWDAAGARCDGFSPVLGAVRKFRGNVGRLLRILFLRFSPTLKVNRQRRNV